MGQALLAENNSLKQKIFELKGAQCLLQNQHEDALNHLLDELAIATSAKSALENENTVIVDSLASRIDHGIKLNEELNILIDTPNNIQDYMLKLQVINTNLNRTSYLVEEQKALVAELQAEINSKTEIIFILKEDLDKLNNKNKIVLCKCDALQLHINSGLNNAISVKDSMTLVSSSPGPSGTKQGKVRPLNEVPIASESLMTKNVINGTNNLTLNSNSWPKLPTSPALHPCATYDIAKIGSFKWKYVYSWICVRMWASPSCWI